MIVKQDTGPHAELYWKGHFHHKLDLFGDFLILFRKCVHFYSNAFSKVFHLKFIVIK